MNKRYLIKQTLLENPNMPDEEVAKICDASEHYVLALRYYFDIYSDEILERRRQLKERNEKIKKLLPEYTDSQIARLEEITRERVRQIRNKYKIPCANSHSTCRSISEKKLGEIIKDLDTELGFEKICKKHNVSSRVVRSTLKSYSVEYRDRKTELRDLRASEKGISVEQFIECFHKHKIHKDWSTKMAKELGVLQAAVYSRFRNVARRGLVPKEDLACLKIRTLEPAPSRIRGKK